MVPRRLSVFAAVILTLAASCSQQGDAAQGDTVQGATEPQWLEPIQSLPTKLPPRTLGSPYESIFDGALAGIAKGEFETTEQYLSRFANIKNTVQERWGSLLVFRPSSTNVKYDADARVLFLNSSYAGNRIGSEIQLGTVNPTSSSPHITKSYAINIVGCTNHDMITVDSETGRQITEGLRDESLDLHYIGELDFSRPGSINANGQLRPMPVPGFRVVAAKLDEIRWLSGRTADFRLQETRIVDHASGAVVLRTTCSA